VYQAPKGTQDVLPDDVAAWRYVESACHRVARTFGYGEIRTPTFEETGLFLKGVGETTDIAEKEMYSFKDKGGAALTLRPEATATVMRAYLEHGLFNRPQPVRLYSLINAFRHDQPQAGRLREFHQWNCEAVGESDPIVDAEVIALLWELLRAVGLRGLSVQLNSIGDANCRPAFVQALVEYFEQHERELCEDDRRRLRTNPLRLLDCKQPQCQPIIAAAPRSVDYLCGPCAEHFAALRGYLEAIDLPITINPRLVRGLDYYPRTVFEVWPPAVGGQSTLGGGGRYDGLIELLGGKPTPGVGFAMGIERVILNLKAQQVEIPAEPGSSVYVGYFDAAGKRQAWELCERLRHAGTSAVVASGERSLKAQLRQANSLGAAWAVICGGDELQRGEVVLRNLRESGQETLSPEAALRRLAGRGDPEGAAA
jgi:histidyl-tRNA synthetase